MWQLFDNIVVILGVLKCKKDRTLPGGQLCPMCSSPRHIWKRELQAVENLICSSPVISSSRGTYKQEDIESEVMTTEDFREPLGNISMGLSDEHGNQVNLECSIGERRETTKISWEQISHFQLASNITLSVDLSCPVDRNKYEQLWKLIAYYSNVPAHLKRGNMLSKEPHPTYVYKQDTEKDALYYTGVKANIMAQPAWLMQTSADLQLNRLQSSATMVKLFLSMDFTETADAKLVRRQKRAWVMIKSANTTHKVLTAMLESPGQMNCNVHSSGQPVIYWMVPDGSKVKAPYISPDNRVSLSDDGQLIIKSVSHIDTGTYYCIAKVHGDLAVLPFQLTVQESSSPPTGDNDSTTHIKTFSGNPVYLPCAATGSPDVEINWILPVSKIISFHANSSRAVVYSNGTLHIPEAHVLDSGYYKCIAINQHGADTLATEITVARHLGVTRPLRKFVGPQSASGVNTQIKVRTQDIEEASGHNEATQEGSSVNRLDPWKRRILGGVPPGRRGIHPTGRNMWRRPSLVRKPTGSHVDDKNKNVVENRRRVNMSRNKIDPEKWADILAKIRDRNAHNTVTPFPVSYTTERSLTDQITQSQESIEGSSDDVTVLEKVGQGYFITQHTPVSHTPSTQYPLSTQDQGTNVTSNSYTTHNIGDMTKNSQYKQIIHTKVETHTTQAAYTSQGTNVHRTSDSVFFLPQTTSVPLHAVTLWQTDTSSSNIFSLQENHSTYTVIGEVKTDDSSKSTKRKKKKNKLNVLITSNKQKSRGSQPIPSVNQNESEKGQEENGKYVSEITTTSQSHSRPKDTTFNDLQSEAMLTTAFTTTAYAPTTTWKGSGGQSPSRIQQSVPRRRNGGRRNRPNKRKQKLNKTTPANTLLTKVKATASTQLKIEVTANVNNAVPFTGSQVASSNTLSHKESTVSRHDSKVVTKSTSLPNFPLGSLRPSAKPLLESTLAAPSFPTAFPGVGHAKTSSQTTSRISESASLPEQLDMFTPTTEQRFTGRPPPLVKPSEETQRMRVTGGLVPVPQSDNSSVSFHSATKVQTDVEKFEHAPNKDETILLKMTGENVSLLQSPSASAASSVKYEYISGGLITTPSILLESDLQSEQLSLPNSSNTNKSKSINSEVEWHLQETENAVVNINPLTTGNPTTVSPFSTSSRPDSMAPFREALYVTTRKPSSTGARIVSSVKVTTQEPPVITTEPTRTSDYHPATQSLDYTPTYQASTLNSVQTATLTPTVTAIQTNLFREELPASTQIVSRLHQLPGQGSIPRGKPRIHKTQIQNFTVNAETDAQLPCEAEGRPMPFLSWTQITSGMYDSIS